MVTDDPEHKKNLKTALAGAFDDDKISKFIVCCLSTNVKYRWLSWSLNCFAVSLLQFCFRERRGACQWHHRQWCCWSDRYRTGYSIKSASDVIRVSRVLDGTDKITLTIVGEWILATMTYLVCSVVSRAANDPSVFTNKEKAPTSSFKRHYAYQVPKYGKLIWNWDLGHRCKNLLTVGYCLFIIVS